MECVSITVFATPGQPAAVGHLGTVFVSPPNADGEIKLEFTLRRKGMRHLQHPGYRKLDGPRKSGKTKRKSG